MDLPSDLEILRLVAERLQELGIRFHLGGSFASTYHGVPRQTRDADFVVMIEADQVESLCEVFRGDFYVDSAMARRCIETGQCFNLIHLETAFKVDFFPAGKGAFDRSEFERAALARLPGAPPLELPMKSAEDTILRKLLWYRSGGESSPRQWRDVLGILTLQGDRLDSDYLARWAEELELQELLERASLEAEP